MNKLKNKKLNNLLSYQHFLKNDSLKKKRFKLKNILFENQILYKNQDLNIIELNNFNIQIPSTVIDFKNIHTINNIYENQLLFNYDLNYNILYNFNKIIFNYKKKNNNDIIKGRVVTGNNKKTLISILGIIFSMKSINLNNLINNKKEFYTKKLKKNKFKYGNFFYTLKKIKIKQIIRTYKLRYLNFKIKKLKNKEVFSRNLYLEEVIKFVRKIRIKNLKKIMILEKKKSNFSRKEYVKKQIKKK